MNKAGILHKLMLALILIAGFGVALIWPQVQKKLDIHYARQAAQIGQQLAQAEQLFFEKNKFYTADFAQLGLELPCASVVEKEHSILRCRHYDFVLEQADVIRVSNTKYPKWFTVSLQDGTVSCGHEDGSLVGARICAPVDL